MTPVPVPVPQPGAEAVFQAREFLGAAVLAKHRQPKAYRDARLDARLRAERTRAEAALLGAARAAGVPVPAVLDADRAAGLLLLEPIAGRTLREALADDTPATAAARLRDLGALLARLHDAGIVHGDLTTSNVLVPAGGVLGVPAGGARDKPSLVLIDFGLGAFTVDAEERGVDLHLLEEALEATQERATELFAAFLDAYGAKDREATLRRLDGIRERGRYRS